MVVVPHEEPIVPLTDNIGWRDQKSYDFVASRTCFVKANNWKTLRSRVATILFC